MKLMILAHAQHGKDTVAEILKYYFSMDFESSSFFFIKRNFKELNSQLEDKYSSPLELFNNRDKHRKFLYDSICEYVKDDPNRLTVEIFEENDTYVGCRDPKQVQSARDSNIVDLVIWVDASERVGPEPFDSCKVSKKDADIIIDNNGTKEELKDKVIRIFSKLKLY